MRDNSDKRNQGLLYLLNLVIDNFCYFVFRHVLVDDSPCANEETEHAYVNVLTRGDLSSLRWIASHLKYATGTQGTTELCTVNYTSLNFRDIMLATGKLPPDALPGDLAHQDCILGMEFSGRNRKGERIMGLLPAQALATTVMADQRFTWKVSFLLFCQSAISRVTSLVPLQSVPSS